MSATYTPEANDIMKYAETEALRSRLTHIGPEQILVAILTNTKCQATRMLVGMQKNPEALLNALLEHDQSGHNTGKTWLPLSPAALQVEKNAIHEAEMCARKDVDSIDLLLGILTLGHGVAWQVLGDTGLRSAEVRAIRQQRKRHDDVASEDANPASLYVLDGVRAMVLERLATLPELVPSLENLAAPLTNVQAIQYGGLLGNLLFLANNTAQAMEWAAERYQASQKQPTK